MASYPIRDIDVAITPSPARPAAHWHAAAGVAPRLHTTWGMTRFATTLALSCLFVLARPALADACSIVYDYVDPPATLEAYDETQAPPVPQILGAEIVRHEEGELGCNMSSCGDFSGLSLDLRVPLGVDNPILRIEHPDGTEVFATSFAGQDGSMHLFLAGYEAGDGDELRIEIIADSGYPSLPVTATVIDPEAGGGCAIGAGPSTGALVIVVLLAGRLRRRRATA